jgi:hypothetical protein
MASNDQIDFDVMPRYVRGTLGIWGLADCNGSLCFL